MNKDLLPIEAIVEKLNLPEKYVEHHGPYGAKLKLDLLTDASLPVRGKLILVTATTLVALSAFPFQVQGQSPSTPAIGPAPRTVNLTAEQEFIIREIVLKDLNVPEAKSDTTETIGDAVPESIELHPFPPDVAAKVPQVKSHEFFVKDEKIILVSSSDRRIADVIQKAK